MTAYLLPAVKRTGNFSDLKKRIKARVTAATAMLNAAGNMTGIRYICLMEQIAEKPESLEEAFFLLEKGRSVEVKTMDAVRILQSTQEAAYKVRFNIPGQGISVIVPYKISQSTGIGQ